MSWQPGAYRVAVPRDGAPARLVRREGLVWGPFALGPDDHGAVQLVHIPTASVVAEHDCTGPLRRFHEALLSEFGALDWRRGDLAALTTADHYIRAQALRQRTGCRP